MTDVFLSCDWGTSSFRLKLIQVEDFRVLGQVASEVGALALSSAPSRAEAFASYLAQAADKLLAQVGLESLAPPIWISGMASSSIGWREVPYTEVPVDLRRPELVIERVGPLSSDLRSEVQLVSGLRTHDDVMRGEETQTIGLLDSPARRAFREDSVVILPGTHSKHVRIAAGRIVDLSTFMTGELFDLLRRASVLRHSIAPDAHSFAPGLEDAFLAGVRAGRERPLLSAIFQVRTGEILGGRTSHQGASYLSGVLIGSELSHSPLLLDARRVLLAASNATTGLYALALEALGLPAEVEVVPHQELELACARGHALLRATHGDGDA